MSIREPHSRDELLEKAREQLTNNSLQLDRLSLTGLGASGRAKELRRQNRLLKAFLQSEQRSE
jgi:hypothetical protein